MSLTTEGVILHTTPFGEHDRILTLFTDQCGLLKLLVKKHNTNLWRDGALDPLTRAEFSYTLKSGNELGTCRDISVISHQLHLRKELSWLKCVGALAYAIKRSQLALKPAPELYKLFVCYLERISLVEDPLILQTSFYLKMLKHDGLFDFTPACGSCGDSLTAFSLAEERCFCPSHAAPNATTFSAEESHLFFLLTFTQSFKEIAALNCPPSFAQKIETLFEKKFFL